MSSGIEALPTRPAPVTDEVQMVGAIGPIAGEDGPCLRVAADGADRPT